MAKDIARIVASNSHVDYVARVIDTLDVAEPPRPEDYGFGTFVRMESPGNPPVAGVVYNSLLVNPDYSNFGPRLSESSELAGFSPDFLNEQGCLLAIIALGVFADDSANQRIPQGIIPPGTPVRVMSDQEFVLFHTSKSKKVSLDYFGRVVATAGPFAIDLVERIIDRIHRSPLGAEEDVASLEVLRRSLVWQRTVGDLRL